MTAPATPASRAAPHRAGAAARARRGAPRPRRAYACPPARRACPAQRAHLPGGGEARDCEARGASDGGEGLGAGQGAGLGAGPGAEQLRGGDLCGRTCAAEVLLRRHQYVEGLGGLAGHRGGTGARRAVGRQPRVRWARGGLLRGAGEARHFGSGDGRRRPVGELERADLGRCAGGWGRRVVGLRVVRRARRERQRADRRSRARRRRRRAGEVQRR